LAGRRARRASFKTDTVSSGRDPRWKGGHGFSWVRKGQAIGVTLWPKHSALSGFARHGHAVVLVRDIGWDEQSRKVQLEKPRASGLFGTLLSGLKLDSDEAIFRQRELAFKHAATYARRA